MFFLNAQKDRLRVIEEYIILKLNQLMLMERFGLMKLRDNANISFKKFYMKSLAVVY